MNTQHSRRILAAAVAAAAFSLSLAVPAQEHRFEGARFDGPHQDGGHFEHHFEGGRTWAGDIRAFHEHDIELWRGGRWFHGPHGGRAGWWWIVGGVWYFYPTPVYPYPDPYQPPVVVLPADQVGAPPQYFYYCSNPAGYYPYVASCLVPWTRVSGGPAVSAPPPGAALPPPGAATDPQGVPPPQ